MHRLVLFGSCAHVTARIYRIWRRSQRLYQLLFLGEVGLQLVEGAVHHVCLGVVGYLGGGCHPALHLGDLTDRQARSASMRTLGRSVTP